MTFRQRRDQVMGYLGTLVRIEIDRPVGYVHHKDAYDLHYPINYGYIPDVLGGDGEELDVFLVGVEEPVSEFEGQIVGVVFRNNDVEDKLIMAPVGMRFSAEELYEAVRFQEKYYDSHVKAL